MKSKRTEGGIVQRVCTWTQPITLDRESNSRVPEQKGEGCCSCQHITHTAQRLGQAAPRIK